MTTKEALENVMYFFAGIGAAEVFLALCKLAAKAF